MNVLLRHDFYCRLWCADLSKFPRLLERQRQGFLDNYRFGSNCAIEMMIPLLNSPGTHVLFSDKICGSLRKSYNIFSEHLIHLNIINIKWIMFFLEMIQRSLATVLLFQGVTYLALWERICINIVRPVNLDSDSFMVLSTGLWSGYVNTPRRECDILFVVLTRNMIKVLRHRWQGVNVFSLKHLLKRYMVTILFVKQLGSILFRSPHERRNIPVCGANSPEILRTSYRSGFKLLG